MSYGRGYRDGSVRGRRFVGRGDGETKKIPPSISLIKLRQLESNLVVIFETLMHCFVKKKERSGVENTLTEIMLQGMQPNEAVLRMLKALREI